jgi:hypothetical protein
MLSCLFPRLVAIRLLVRGVSYLPAAREAERGDSSPNTRHRTRQPMTAPLMSHSCTLLCSVPLLLWAQPARRASPRLFAFGRGTAPLRTNRPPCAHRASHSTRMDTQGRREGTEEEHGGQRWAKGRKTASLGCPCTAPSCLRRVRGGAVAHAWEKQVRALEQPKGKTQNDFTDVAYHFPLLCCVCRALFILPPARERLQSQHRTAPHTFLSRSHRYCHVDEQQEGWRGLEGNTP